MGNANEKRDGKRAKIGRKGEDLAARYLRERGWTIRARNVSMKIGELDIVASKEESLAGEPAETVAFVEVKSRASSSAIPAEKNVTYRKRRKLTTLAKIFLDDRGWTDVCARFDIVTVDFETEPPEIAHYPAAFDAVGRYN